MFPWEGLEQANAAVKMSEVDVGEEGPTVQAKFVSGAKSLFTNVRKVLDETTTAVAVKATEFAAPPTSTGPPPPQRVVQLSAKSATGRLWNAALPSPPSEHVPAFRVEPPPQDTARNKTLTTRSAELVARVARVLQRATKELSAGYPLTLLTRMRAHARQYNSECKAVANDSEGSADALCALNASVFHFLSNVPAALAGAPTPPTNATAAASGAQ